MNISYHTPKYFGEYPDLLPVSINQNFEYVMHKPGLLISNTQPHR